MNFQKQDIFQFVNDLQECVQEQQNEVSKAAIGLGQWTLAPCYSHIGQKVNNWFGSMSQTEKQDVLSSLHTTSTLPYSMAEDSNLLTEPHLYVASGGSSLSVPFSP